jgi:PEP-CTERM motif
MSIKSLSIVAAAAMSLFAGAAQAVDVPVELAVNGDFSAGLDGWTTFNTSGGSNGSITLVDGAAVLDSGAPGLTPKAFTLGIKNANVGIGTVMAGEQVTISFDVKGTYDVGGVSFASLFSELAGGGVSSSELLGGAPLFATPQCTGFNTTSFARCTFTAMTGPDVAGGITVELVSSTGGALNSAAKTTFDNVSISVMRPVPEPGTYALMLAGLVGVGAIARRRRAV